MHQLFLDANTYLGFYSLSPADVTELRKLLQLIELSKLRVLLPAQVADEVRRNRARVLAEALKPLREARLQVPVPGLASGMPLADELRDAVASTQRAHTKLLEELTQGARERTLLADRLIADLFSAAKPLTHAGALEAAQRRKALGNPPGKGNSLGDGVNWETLLAFGKRTEDLCFVSRDGDFANPLDPEEFDDFLADEWRKAKSSSVHFFRDIKGFLDEYFPDIRLASDVRKYFLIDALLNSSNFAETHQLVGEIARYETFTLDETQRILSGGMENSQVRWLAQDDDVQALVERLLAAHQTALPKLLVARWEYLLAGHGRSYGSAPTEQDLAAMTPKGDSL